MSEKRVITEAEVLEFIALKQQGYKGYEIAEIYNIKPGTVSRRISEYLGLREKKGHGPKCNLTVMDCLNCKKVDCDYIGPIQPHETHDLERAPNLYTIDMVVSIAKKE